MSRPELGISAAANTWVMNTGINECMTVPGLPFASCVTVGKLLNLSVLLSMTVRTALPHRVVMRLMGGDTQAFGVGCSRDTLSVLLDAAFISNRGS